MTRCNRIRRIRSQSQSVYSRQVNDFGSNWRIRKFRNQVDWLITLDGPKETKSESTKDFNPIMNSVRSTIENRNILAMFILNGQNSRSRRCSGLQLWSGPVSLFKIGCPIRLRSSWIGPLRIITSSRVGRCRLLSRDRRRFCTVCWPCRRAQIHTIRKLWKFQIRAM